MRMTMMTATMMMTTTEFIMIIITLLVGVWEAVKRCQDMHNTCPFHAALVRNCWFSTRCHWIVDSSPSYVLCAHGPCVGPRDYGGLDVVLDPPRPIDL